MTSDEKDARTNLLPDGGYQPNPVPGGPGKPPTVRPSDIDHDHRDARIAELEAEVGRLNHCLRKSDSSHLELLAERDALAGVVGKMREAMRRVIEDFLYDGAMIKNLKESIAQELGKAMSLAPSDKPQGEPHD